MGHTYEKKKAFLLSERSAQDKFMRKFENADFSCAAGSVGYSREYRCECGFRTADAKTIYSHSEDHR